MKCPAGRDVVQLEMMVDSTGHGAIYTVTACRDAV